MDQLQQPSQISRFLAAQKTGNEDLRVPSLSDRPASTGVPVITAELHDMVFAGMETHPRQPA
jgi:hypothetical protein